MAQTSPPASITPCPLVREAGCVLTPPSVPDVDAPRDLTVTNVQGDHATLTWNPPRSHINGYILSYGSANDTMRVSAVPCPLHCLLQILYGNVDLL